MQEFVLMLRLAYECSTTRHKGRAMSGHQRKEGFSLIPNQGRNN